MTKAEFAASPAVVFDLDDFDTQDTAEMIVQHPDTGEPTTWKITFAGPGHAVTVALGEKAARETLRTAKAREQARINGKKVTLPDEEPDALRRKNAEYFAARMIGWTPVRINGQDYPFNQENAVKLLLDPRKGRLYGQVIEFLGDENSFTKRSATT